MPSLRAASSIDWLEAVLADFDAFLIDHAACERKASATAMTFVSHFPDLAGCASPRPAQGSLPTRAGSPLAEQDSHLLDDKRSFLKSSHDSVLSDPPCLVALAASIRLLGR